MVEVQGNIKTYLDRISEIGIAEARELELVAEKQPWCSAYHTLIARCYENEQSFSAEKKLNQASLYTGDRSVLFKWMHDAPLPTKEKQIVIKPEELSGKAVSESEEHPEAIFGDEAMEEVDIPDLLSNNKAEAPEPKIDFDKIVTYDPAQELHPTDRKDQVQRIEIPFDRIAYNPEVELAKLIEDKEGKTPEKGDENPDASAHDFIYWLDHLDTKEPEPEVLKVEPKPEVKGNVDEVQQLLQKFLESKSKRTPLRHQEFYNAENRARESEQDESTLVSESLANVYLKQKLFDKAIKTFEKLSLQNPSKSAYFAARIKEVLELIREHS